jgi:hypothetical protein
MEKILTEHSNTEAVISESQETINDYIDNDIKILESDLSNINLRLKAAKKEEERSIYEIVTPLNYSCYITAVKKATIQVKNIEKDIENIKTSIENFKKLKIKIL